MKLENAAKGLCVICSQQMATKGKHICKKCRKLCALKHRNEQWDDEKTVGFRLMDIKSACCNSDIIISGAMTDSDACHEIFINEMELLHGKYKKVIDETTGIAHKVPLRQLIEYGLAQEDLHKFPLWDGNNMI